MSVFAYIGRVLSRVFVAKTPAPTGRTIKRAATPGMSDAPPQAQRDANHALLKALEACKAGDIAEGLDHFHTALIAFHKAGNPKRARLLADTSTALLSTVKNQKKAMTALKSAQRKFADAKLRDQVVRIYALMGQVQADAQNYSDAFHHFKQAINLARDIGDINAGADARLRYARVQIARGRKAEATVLLAEGEEMLNESEGPERAKRFKSKANAVLEAA